MTNASTASLCSALGLWVGLVGVAQAQTIGRAATIRNDVARLQGARVSVINVGDDVVRNEVVRTGSESGAKLVFSDDTNLAVGPTSRITLDTFVFAGDGTYKKAVVNLVRGAFRFTTGGSEKRAYRILTPVATIGVRGTVLDILSEPGRTTVTLGEGAAIVCARGTRKCDTISIPGQTVVVVANGIQRPGPNGPPPFRFASLCGETGDLCSPARYAALPPATPITLGSVDAPSDWSGFYVGGFGGYGGGNSSQRDNGYTPPAVRAARPAPVAPTRTPTTGQTGTGTIGADGSYGLGGGVGGGLTGYNFQVGRVVLGVEGDIGGSSSSGSSGVCGSSPHRCGTTLGGEADVRGRFGIPFRSVLPFVAAGAAFQRMSAYDSLTGRSGGAWRTGYSVGGGFEYKLGPLVTLRLEYLHSGFGSAHLFDIAAGVPEQISTHTDVVRAGVSFSMSALSLAQPAIGLQ